MIHSKGLKPYFRKSRKDASFHRTFGSVAPATFPAQYSVDVGLGDDQQGMTQFCTAYTVTDIGANEDGILYSVDYQMAKALELALAKNDDGGVDLKTALSVPVVFGLLPATLTNITWQNNGEAFSSNAQNFPATLDTQAALNKKAVDFWLEETESDWFDSIRSALIIATAEKRAIGIGTPWYQEYESVGPTGIVPQGANQISWHSTEIVGWKVINTITYLICKSHQGKIFGDRGYIYFSREEINRIMSVPGSAGGTLAKVLPSDVQTIQLSLWEQILGLYQEIRYKLFPPHYESANNQ